MYSGLPGERNRARNNTSLSAHINAHHAWERSALRPSREKVGIDDCVDETYRIVEAVSNQKSVLAALNHGDLFPK